jgi:hypothetical protein
MTHEEHLRAFCERVNLEFQPLYHPPFLAEQTTLLFEQVEEDE